LSPIIARRLSLRCRRCRFLEADPMSNDEVPRLKCRDPNCPNADGHVIAFALSAGA
jgi:hypothetical protein